MSHETQNAFGQNDDDSFLPVHKHCEIVMCVYDHISLLVTG